MDNNIIEILPKDKKDIQDALEAKICLDVIDSGDVSDEFLDLIWKDMLEEKEMAKDSVFAKVKKLFYGGLGSSKQKELVEDIKIDKNKCWHDDHTGEYIEKYNFSQGLYRRFVSTFTEPVNVYIDGFNGSFPLVLCGKNKKNRSNIIRFVKCRKDHNKYSKEFVNFMENSKDFMSGLKFVKKEEKKENAQGAKHPENNGYEAFVKYRGNEYKITALLENGKLYLYEIDYKNNLTN